MKRILPFLLLIPLSTPSIGVELEFDPCLFQIPPRHYLEGNLIFPNEVIVTTDMQVLRDVCHVPDDWPIYGCTEQKVRISTDEVTYSKMYIYDTGDPVANTCVFKHELAHINGWPGNHPNY